MFKGPSSIEDVNVLSQLKKQVGDLSKRNHVTFVGQTEVPIKELDSLNTNQFNLQFSLNNGITKRQKEYLEKFKTEVERLDNAANESKKKYIYDDKPSSSSSYESYDDPGCCSS